MEAKKKYGLFLPKKNVLGASAEFVPKPSVFNEDSDSESESNVDWVKKSLQKEPYGGGYRTKQSKSDIQKVLAEDPTAYQYDEVYDELQRNINDSLAAKKTDRKPRYIQSLLVQAERRKRENERRLTRQIQKERETEGNEFADKEVFVTSTYKKKLEEMKKMDEQDKHMEMLEDIGDVTKQRDMVGFYRHIYRLTVAKEDLRDPPPEPVSIKSEPRDEEKSTPQPRQFRKRKTSESSESENEQSSEKITKIIPETDIKTEPNPDADSDLSNDDNSDTEQDTQKDTANPLENAGNTDDTKKDEETPESKDEDKENKGDPKSKKLIWQKRTVGEVYDAAVERYYQRKAEKLASKGS